MANFAGTWNAVIDTPIGKINAVFDITDDSGVIGGLARNEHESVVIQDALSSGDRLTWVQAVTKPMKLALKFDVVFDGDTMAGTAKAGIFPASKLHGSRA